MDFYIYDHNNILVTKARKTAQFYYQFEALEVGQYKFFFNNINKENRKITFAIHSGNNTDSSISTEEVDEMFKNIITVDKKISEIKLKQNFINKKTEGHFTCNKLLI